MTWNHVRRKRTGSEKKHGNIHTIVDGITFDSKKEAMRYKTLKLALSEGVITNLILQPEFTLQERGVYVDVCQRDMKRKSGKKYVHSTLRPMIYRADFLYEVVKTVDFPCGKVIVRLEQGERVVEDVKGFKTPEYLLKRKMFLFRFPEYIFIET